MNSNKIKNTASLFIICISLCFSWFTQAKPLLSIEDFTTEAHLRDAEISPNGRYLASVWNEKNRRLVTLKDLETPNATPTVLMSDQIVRPSTVSWANDNVLLVQLLVPANTLSTIRREKFKDDFDINDYRMYRRILALNIETKKSVELLGTLHRFKSNRNLAIINNYLPNDPDHIILQAKSNDRLTLQKVNVNTGDNEEVFTGGYKTYDIVTNADGKPIYQLDYQYYANKIEVFKIQQGELSDEVVTIELEQDEKDKMREEDLISFVKGDEKTLIYRKRNENTGFYEIITRNIATKKESVFISLPNQDVGRLLTAGVEEDIVGFTTLKDTLQFNFFDAEQQRRHDKLALQVGEFNIYYGNRRAFKKKEVIFSYGMDNPGVFYIYDNESEKLTLLSHSALKLPIEHLSIPAQTEIKTRDGLILRAYVLFPPGYEQSKPAPMVIMPHGGPHLRDSADWDGFAQFISTRGYIVVKPNFRGSSGYGKKFEEAGYKQWGKAMQDDLTDVTHYMVKEGYADPKKMCIVGGSYGGYAALQATVKTPDLFQCAISLNGVTHLKEQFAFDISNSGRNEDEVREYLYEKFGNPKKDSADLDIHSPALNAAKINAPVLIIAGEHDKRVPIEQSEMMVRALKKLKKQVEFYEVDDATHFIFDEPEDTVFVYEKIEAFLAKYLN